VYIGRHTQCTSRISLVQGSVANWQPTTLEHHTGDPSPTKNAPLWQTTSLPFGFQKLSPNKDAWFMKIKGQTF